MFASKNKHRRGGNADAAQASSASAQGASSFSRESYGDQAGQSSTADAFSAGKYGSSTRQPSRSNYVPATPAAANAQYAQSASHREFVTAQHAAKKKRRRKRALLVTLSVVLVLLIGGIGAAWAYIAQVDSSLNQGVDEDLLNSLAVTDSPSDPFYMLLIGIDRSQDREDTGEYGGAYRTDSMILARIDPVDKEVTLISIPRDTRVTIEGHGQQKINAAYAFGGAAGAVDAVSELAGVSISHYAEIDFDGFRAVVDALGGVTVDVPMEIDDDMAGGHVDAGEQTLNGEQALILCRSRHNYDDIGDGDAIRAANQRMVISAIMDKVMSSDVATLTNTVTTLSEYITTDYSVTGILGLAQSMVGIDVSSNVYSAAVPTTSVYENDVWWEVLNESEWETMMDRVKQGLPPTEETVVDPASGATMSVSGDSSGTADSDSSSSSSSSSTSLSGTSISVKNGCGVSGVAAEAAAKLTPEGAVVETGNADGSDYEKTLVIYEDSSDKEKAQKVVDLLGCGTLRQNDGTYVFTGDILVVVGADWE